MAIGSSARKDRGLAGGSVDRNINPTGPLDDIRPPQVVARSTCGQLGIVPSPAMCFPLDDAGNVARGGEGRGVSLRAVVRQ